MSFLIDNLTFPVGAEAETAAAPLMSSGAPLRIDGAGAGGNDATVSLVIIATSSYRWESKCLNMAARQTHCQQRLGGMESLGEEVRR